MLLIFNNVQGFDMEKKHQTPQHIEKRRGEHPQPNLKLIRILEEVDDPRGASCNFQHPLTTILFVTLICSLCGADDWEAIVLQARAMMDWLSRFVDVSKGIPSVRTFKRVFCILNPLELERVLREIGDLLSEKTEGMVVSFDGKTMRGTTSSENGLTAIHMLNAWSHDHGICIGHMKVDDKSNEIPALPKLMEILDLRGAIITADALNTQKDTVAKAVELGADYVLPVKGNHPTLYEEIDTLFKDAEKNGYRGVDADDYETVEKSHGRVEVRKYYSLDATELPSTKEWKNLQSVGKVIRYRTEKERTSVETEYYISSCEIDARLLARVVRGHWGIENSLHWVLDVTFREDKLRYRDRIGAQNLASIRKITLGALSKDKFLKCGKKNKRLLAATDPDYREKILKSLF